MADEIVRGIYRLSIPLPRNPLKNLNSYVICGDDRNLIIDTGFRMNECYDAMRKELDSLGIDLTRTDIFLTHMHADHAGLAPVLASERSKIYMSTADAAITGSLDSPERRAELIGSYVADGFPKDQVTRFVFSDEGKNLTDSARLDFTCLKDGDVIEYGSYSFICVLTPGHTPGHMCLYCEELKLMFLGDHVLFDITPNIVRWPYFDNSLREYIESLAKIRQFDIAVALPGHRSDNGLVTDRIDALVEHHSNRLREAARIIEDSSGITAYQVASLMHWDIRCDTWEDFPPAQKWFAFGEALAHIDYLLFEGRIIRENIAGIRRYSINSVK